MNKTIATALASAVLLLVPTSANAAGGWTPPEPVEGLYPVWECDRGFFVQYVSYDPIVNRFGKVVGYTLTDWHPAFGVLNGARSLTASEREILQCDDDAAVKVQADRIERLQNRVQRLRDRLHRQ